MSREVVIVSGCRTAIGSFGGSLKNVPAYNLAATVMKEAINQGVKVLNPGKAKGLVESEPQAEDDLDVETDPNLDEDKEDSQ